MKKPVNNVKDLLGEEISTVAFVRDYVEFHFDGPILRSLSNPTITVHGTNFSFPDVGSRDALCTVIGSTVCAVELDEHLVLELTTTDNSRISIPLDDENRRGPEAMHFVPKLNGPMQVW
jgi:hypothetical protein